MVSRLLALLFLGVALAATRAEARSRDSLFIPVTGGRIGATLTRPDGEARVPVAIIIAGAGGMDRDGNAGLYSNAALRHLGDSLAKLGIATLRYDKRGVGASAALTDESKLRFADYVTDVEACYQWLRKRKDFSRIYIVGYDDGALVGMLSAQKLKPAGLITLASPAAPADELILAQLRRSGTPAAVVDTCENLFNELKRTGTVNIVPENRFYQSMFRPSVQKYLYSWIKVDPTVEIARVSSPVLIVQGDNDVLTDTLQIQRLKAAQPRAMSVLIPGMNHVFRQAPKDPVLNLETHVYADLPLDSKFVRTLASFMKRR